MIDTQVHGEEDWCESTLMITFIRCLLSHRPFFKLSWFLVKNQGNGSVWPYLVWTFLQTQGDNWLFPELISILRFVVFLSWGGLFEITSLPIQLKIPIAFIAVEALHHGRRADIKEWPSHRAGHYRELEVQYDIYLAPFVQGLLTCNREKRNTITKYQKHPVRYQSFKFGEKKNSRKQLAWEGVSLPLRVHYEPNIFTVMN